MPSVRDFRRMLGALDHSEYPEPDGTTANGWYRYPTVLECENCPMCVHESNGLYARVCSVTCEGRPIGAVCSLGIRDDGRGLTRGDFDHRDRDLERRSSYTARNAVDHIGHRVTRARNETELENLRDTCPDVDLWHVHSVEELVDAPGVDAVAVFERCSSPVFAKRFDAEALALRVMHAVAVAGDAAPEHPSDYIRAARRARRHTESPSDLDLLEAYRAVKLDERP